MKIYASKADDLRRARDQWDQESDRIRKLKDAENQQLRIAEEKVIGPVAAAIEDRLRQFSLLDFEVYGDRAGFSRARRDTIEIRVECNQNRIHDAHSALSWDFKVRINAEGEVVKESSSWSGLNACSEEELASLRQTLEALEYLNSIDWGAELQATLPDYKEYMHVMDERGRRPDFDAQIREAELEEIIGKDIMVHGYPIDESQYRPRLNTWYIILRETPKQYEIGSISDYYIEQYRKQGVEDAELFAQAKRWTSRIRKDRLFDHLPNKLEFMELGE